MSQAATTTPATNTDADVRADESGHLAPSHDAGGANLLGESLSPRARLDSVDLLRGLVMVIMALDHVRDFFHADALRFDPTDLSQTNAPLFLTRWVTHFCAPVFVFLAGTGAFLSTSRGKTRGELSRFLLTRGLWLIVLELTIVRFLWTFNLDYDFMAVQVIWALGWAMIVLAGLVYLPTWAITTFGLTMIFLHNAFDSVRAAQFGGIGWLWTILHVPGALQPREGVVFYVQYPLVPWLGVMAVGYSLGKLLLKERAARRKWLVRLGVACVVLFVVLRLTNLYGDPRAWAAQPSGLFTFLSIINLEKYPPSLLYLLATLGPSLLALALFDGARLGGRLARALVVFGRVPLFYYVLHLVVIHGLALVFAFAKYGQDVWLFINPPSGGPPQIPPDYGYGLVVVYLVWLGVVLALYPVCRWFANVKRRNKSAWLSYL